MALEVVEDRTKHELPVKTADDDLYQCDGDPEHEWLHVTTFRCETTRFGATPCNPLQQRKAPKTL